jgi:hypothetical protein
MESVVDEGWVDRGLAEPVVQAEKDGGRIGILELLY